jgi:hypothetical protein
MPTKETRRLIRKMIGEAHWRLYLEYRKQFWQHVAIGPRYSSATLISLFLCLPFPTLSPKLDEHVTSYIFSFRSGKDMYEASKASREFRDALVPRQKNVTMAGFSSFESFRQMNVIGMEYFETGRRKNSVTDDIIKEQNEDTSIPDDEARGGNITINFAEPIVEVYDLGMMDIERRHPPTFVYVTHEVDGGVQQVESFPVIGTGNNGVQSIPIYRFNVTKMTVAFGTSGAIDWITWCF